MFYRNTVFPNSWENYSLSFSHFYLTSEDFITAIESLLHSTNVSAAFHDWFANVISFSSTFHFPLCRLDDLPLTPTNLIHCKIPLYEDGVIYFTLCEMQDLFSMNQDIASGLSDLLLTLKNAVYNRGRSLSDFRMEEYPAGVVITGIFTDNLVEFLNEEEKELFKKLVVHLESSYMTCAMQCHAYFLCHDNSVFDMDIDSALNLYHVLADQDEDIDSCYRLANLYETHPELDQLELAVKYYTVAAMGGHPQAKYRLIVLMATGKGIPRNLKSARSMAERFYFEEKKKFCSDIFSFFPYAACAMGIVTEQLDPDKKDNAVVYSYYLEAYYAIRRMMQGSPLLDAFDLYEEIHAHVLSMKDSFLRSNSLRYSSPMFPNRLLSSCPLHMQVVSLSASTKLSFTPQEGFQGTKLMLTVEDADYCELVSKVDLRYSDFTTFESVQETDFDNLDYSASPNFLTLYKDGTPVFDCIYSDYVLSHVKRDNIESLIFLKFETEDCKIGFCRMQEPYSMHRGQEFIYLYDNTQYVGKAIAYVSLIEKEIAALPTGYVFLSDREMAQFA